MIDATYKVPFRRRREGKTDYRQRLKLLKSGKTRAIVRKTLSKVIVQFANYDEKGDKIVSSTTSNELKKVGWKYSLKNTPACYLTGLIAGKRALKNGVKEAVLDIGLIKIRKRITKEKSKRVSGRGWRVFAVLKGLIDAGINIQHSKEILPSEDRIKGKHIKEEIAINFEEVKKKIGG